MTDPSRISPHEAAEKMKAGFTYLDVRTEPEFAEGHPEGSVNVPVMNATAEGMTPNVHFLRVVEASFPKDAKLVVGCKGGTRSMRGARALLDAGFVNVLVQRAGWNGITDPFGKVTEPGWSRVDLPQETGAPEDRSYAALKSRM